MYRRHIAIAVCPDAEFANGRYSAHMRLCWVIGKARRARSKVRLVRVTIGWSNRNDRYISHILGILLSRMRARSKRAFTFLYSDANMAEFNFPRCFILRVKYWERSAMYSPNNTAIESIPSSRACRIVAALCKLSQAQKLAPEECHVET